jgi:hypothetical protein
MSLQWHNWNAQDLPPRPQLLDATLSELAADPHLPSPTLEQAVTWMKLGRQLGIHHYELMTLKGLTEVENCCRWLDALADQGPAEGWVLSLRERCPWPERLMKRVQRLGQPPEVRWIPDSPDPDLSHCRRLADLGVPVSLVIPNSHQLDPIRLNRWVMRARHAGIAILEMTGRRGAPWRSGIQALLEFVKGIVVQERLRLTWSSDHGFGLALSQALEAWHSGADRLRCSLFGCGIEGNAPLELLLVNLDLDFPQPDKDLSRLAELCHFGEETFDLEPGSEYPVFGRDAFRTATGVHAAAIVKALAQGQGELADLVYSAVCASRLGLAQRIEVGPMSGKANLKYWLDGQSLPHDSKLIECMLLEVKQRAHVLTDLELIDLYHSLAA